MCLETHHTACYIGLEDVSISPLSMWYIPRKAINEMSKYGDTWPADHLFLIPTPSGANSQKSYKQINVSSTDLLIFLVEETTLCLTCYPWMDPNAL